MHALSLSIASNQHSLTRLLHPCCTTLQTFRLTLSEEVKPALSRCQRSQTTGELLITMPKVRPNETIAAMRRAQKAKDGSDSGFAGARAGGAGGAAGGRGGSSAARAGSGAAVGGAGAGAPSKLGDELLAAAMAAGSLTGAAKEDGEPHLAGPVRLSGLAGSSAPSKSVGAAQLPDGHGGTMLFRPSESRRLEGAAPSSAATADHGAAAGAAGGASKAAAAGSAAAAGTQPSAGSSGAGAGGSVFDDDDLPPLV